jgi:hypothetical protein
MALLGRQRARRLNRRPQQAQRWGVLAPEGYVGLNIYATKAVHVEGNLFKCWYMQE